jgi:flagellar biogenesis protein FliO
MISSQQFLVCSFFGCLLLTVSALLGEEVPPLPSTSANNMLLKRLGAAFSNKGEKITKTTPSEPARSVQPDTQEMRVHEKLPPPKPITQASFTTIPLKQLPKKTEESASPLEKELPPEPQDESPSEPKEDSNETLDKQIFSRKTTNADDSDESEKPSIGGWKNKLAKPELTPLVSVGGSLFIVIAAFFLLVIVLRKIAPKGNRPLPQEAFECLGRYYLTQKHQVQLLRIGSRIILVSVMPDGVRTLSEITDPDEAVAVLGLCRRLDNNSATEMFRKTVASISEDELTRAYDRPIVTPKRKGQSATSFDIYSEPDESLAAILARGRHTGR